MRNVGWESVAQIIPERLPNYFYSHEVFVLATYLTLEKYLMKSKPALQQNLKIKYDSWNWVRCKN